MTRRELVQAYYDQGNEWYKHVVPEFQVCTDDTKSLVKEWLDNEDMSEFERRLHKKRSGEQFHKNAIVAGCGYEIVPTMQYEFAREFMYCKDWENELDRPRYIAKSMTDIYKAQLLCMSKAKDYLQ